MTIVCAYSNDEGTWIGSDGRIMSGDTIARDNHRKWKQTGDFYAGVSGSWALMDPLIHALSESIELGSIYFGGLDANLRKGLSAIEWKQESTGGDQGYRSLNALLAGPQGVWHMDSSLLCIEVPLGEFMAIGSGREFAFGAAHAIRCEDGEAIVTGAIRAAVRYDTGCGGEPYVFKLLPCQDEAS